MRNIIGFLVLLCPFILFAQKATISGYIEDAKSGIDAGIKGRFKTIGIGPKDRVGHADVYFSSMSSLNFDIIQSSFYPLL